MTFIEAIQPILTPDNARAYAATGEKYLFVCDLIESCDKRANEARVNILEDIFDKMRTAAWLFTFDDITGRAEALPQGGFYIQWGGMGFHLEAAVPELRAAVFKGAQA